MGVSLVALRSGWIRTVARAALALLAALGLIGPAHAAELTFNRAYQGSLSGQTFTTTTALVADPGSIRFADGGTQRSFQNTSGTLYYTVGGVQHSETGVLNSRYPNGNTLMDAVAFSGTGGDRLLALGSSYASGGSYSGSSNAIVAKLNEYILATAPDPSQTTLLVNGGSSATVAVGQSATIVVTVKLGSGAAVAGASVSLSASPGGYASISPATTTTNSSGQASFTALGLSSGTVTFNAVASANGTTTSSAGSVSITYTGTRSASQSTAVVPNGIVGTATAVTVTVRDSAGNSVTGAASALAATIGGTNAGASPSAISDQGNGTYLFTYVPTAAGTDSVAIRLDGTQIGGSPYSSVVAAPTLVFAPAPGALTAGTVGTAYSRTISVSGGTAPYSFSGTGLPAGLVVDPSTGALTGSPTSAGSFTITVTATDAHGTTGSATYSMNVAVAAPVANAVSASVAANSANNPVALNLSGGAATAVAIAGQAAHGTATAAGTSITYTPAQGYSGSDSFTYTASNASGTSAAATVTLTVSSPTLSFTPAPGALAGGTVGNAYSQTVAVSGGNGPYSFSATGLPAGLSIDASTGAVTGTPTSAGAYPLAVSATDAHGATGSANYTIAIAVQSPIANAVSANVAANSASNPIALGLTGGAPTSIAIVGQPGHGTASASGTAITYTPTPGYSGSDSFTYTASNATGTSPAATVNIIVAAPTLGFAPAPGGLPGGTVGIPYSESIAVSGGTGPYTITAQGLPGGLTIDPATGAVSGTPSAAGSASVTVHALDAHGATGSATYTITIAGQAPVASSVATTVAANSTGNAVALALSGGSATSVAIAATPAHGVAAVNGLAVTYTPAQGYSGADSFTYTVSNAFGTSSAATVSVTVTATPLALAPAPGALPPATVGTPYSQAISATGGTAPYSFAATGLPAGLAIDPSTGALTGAPTAPGTYWFTLGATDAHGATGSASYGIVVAVPAPVTNGVSATIAANSTGTSVALNVTGGAATSVSVTSQAGHGTASASGTAITYTPLPGFSGSDSFTYTATNAAGTSAPALVTITVSAPTLSLSPSAGGLPGGTVGVAYSQTISASGGTAPYSYTAAGLPAGLTIDPSTGAVTGTPTAAETYSVTVGVTDAHGATGTAAYTIAISGPVPIVGAVAIAVPANSSNNPVALALTGGSASAVAVASPAAHGTASVSGTTLSYTPAPGYSGSDSFTYTASNATGASAAATVSVTVGAPALTFAPAPGSLPGGTAGTAYSAGIAVAGGTGPYSFAATGLPDGLRIDASTGTISGTAATPGSYPITVTVTDALGATGSASYTLAFATPPPPVAADATSATVPANTKTEAGQNVGINLSSLVSGEFDEIRIIAQPAHGKVVITRRLAMRAFGSPTMMMALLAASAAQGPGQVMAIYTPDPDYQGADSFQFAAIGPGGMSAPATVAIEVVGRAPTARAQTVAAVDGQPISVDLTAGATGGPFTAAALVGVSPSDQASAQIVAGTGSTSGSFGLNVTPKAHFGGKIVVTFTLSNAFGTSAPATVTVDVTRRPDPAADPIVGAISDAQAEAARRFARAQTANFMQRAESLHGDCALSTNGIRLGSADGASGPIGDARSDHDDRGLPTPADAAHAADRKAGTRPDTADEKCRGPVAVWTGGTVDIGTRDAVSGRSKISATTAGVSAGIDARVGKHAVLGVGAGLGRDRSSIGDRQGRVAAHSAVIATYGSVTPLPGMFVDGMLAHGWLDFATRRSDSTTAAVARGQRHGRFTSAALASGIDRSASALQWSLYGRVEYLAGRLDAYREEGAGIYDLRFDRHEIRSTTGTLGFRSAYRRPLSFGTLSATLRGEWQHEFTGATPQGLDYADVSGASFYSLRAQNWSREQFTLAPGIGLSLPSDWDLGLSLGIRAASGERAATTSIQVRKSF